MADPGTADELQDKKIEVLIKDVPEDVQTEVADICMAAPNIGDYRKYSKLIRDTLDSKFGKGWNVIMGESFAGSCSVAKNGILQIRITGTLILVFKSCSIIKESTK
ncbi:dynein light chain 4, axonemal [Nematocida displodere]|uniref:Dynein light chain 4, axonemal n=1 Tax=Nematocida displodere TaxID=1805483 RepID=A0A177EB71_9MICR|nr:dynein light chain 4, axonemal [Nematocida displodere]